MQTETTLYFPSKYGLAARAELRETIIPERIRQYELNTLILALTNFVLDAKSNIVLGGCTLTDCVGVWYGTRENITKVSAIVDEKYAELLFNALRHYAQDIKKQLYQETVLITSQAIYGEFV